MELAISAIRAAVDEGKMKPGVLYSAYQLAEALGISRTPVRDALLRLEEVGLIRFENRQGFRILQPQPREIAEIFAVRIALECPAVARSAQSGDHLLAERLTALRRQMDDAARADDETAFSALDVRLHDTLLDAAGNQRARQIIAALRETTRLLGASTAGTTRSLLDIAAEHDPIIDAVVAGDATVATEAMRAHLLATGKLLLIQALQPIDDARAADDLWNAIVD
jgi:DNA-binding GntR family transcriptional regulator